jgi:hypothetical protein
VINIIMQIKGTGCYKLDWSNLTNYFLKRVKFRFYLFNPPPKQLSQSKVEFSKRYYFTSSTKKFQIRIKAFLTT